jgi:hypothetical protein
MLHPLAHPIHGLTKHNILHFTRDMAHYVHLTVTVQNWLTTASHGFPKIHQSHEDDCSFWHDLLGFLGFDHEQQHIVIQKFRLLFTRLPIEQLLTFIMLDK